mgnify:CR=1 FL=1
MNFIEFCSRRFKTEIIGPLQFGDEVIDEYNIKAVVVRDPYPVGTDAQLFTLIYYGRVLSSKPVNKLRKTGRNYVNELNTIFNGLARDEAEAEQ